MNVSIPGRSQELYEKLIPTALGFIHEGVDGTQQGNPLKMVIYQTELNMVTQFCTMYESMFPTTIEIGDVTQAIVYEVDALECGFLEVN